MELLEDAPKYGQKHAAVIKQNQYKQLDWFILYSCADGQNATNHA
jgi:hypothetical protein